LGKSRRHASSLRRSRLAEVVDTLHRVPNPSIALDFRLRVLAAGGLNPSADCQALRAYKSAWEVYLSAAFACGLLDGEHGRDLRERLTHALRCFA